MAQDLGDDGTLFGASGFVWTATSSGLFMQGTIHVVAAADGSYSVYRGDVLLLYNVDYELAIACGGKLKSLEAEPLCGDEERPSAKLAPALVEPSRVRTGGRALLLSPHIDIVWDMVDKNPRTSVKDVQNRLLRLGVKFSSVTAITNLARKHGLKLVA